MLLPRRVLVPLHRVLVGQKDVGLPVAINVRDGEAVADGDLIDLLQAELWFGWGGEDEQGAERQERGQLHRDGLKPSDLTCPPRFPLRCQARTTGSGTNIGV